MRWVTKMHVARSSYPLNASFLSFLFLSSSPLPPQNLPKTFIPSVRMPPGRSEGAWEVGGAFLTDAWCTGLGSGGHSHEHQFTSEGVTTPG